MAKLTSADEKFIEKFQLTGYPNETNVVVNRSARIEMYESDASIFQEAIEGYLKAMNYKDINDFFIKTLPK